MPDISPTPDAEWDYTGVMEIFTLNFTKGASAYTSTQKTIRPNTTSATDHDSLVYQFVGPPLAAQTISGTFKSYVQARENAATSNFRSQIILRVVNKTGTVVRGVLYAGDLTSLTGDPASEWNASTSVEVNRAFPTGGSTALSSLAILAEDRIVAEYGGRSHRTGATNGFGAIAIGEAGSSVSTDLPEDETDNTTTKAPWIEFSGTIGLYVPPKAIFVPRRTKTRLRR